MVAITFGCELSAGCKFGIAVELRIGVDLMAGGDMTEVRRVGGKVDDLRFS